MTRFRTAAGLRRALLGAAVVCAAVAIVDLFTGGFALRVGVLRLSSHSPLRPFVLALAAGSLYVLSDRRQSAAELSALEGWLGGHSSAIAALIAAAACLIGLVWGTHAAGGSDSYCYIGQAEEFVSGRLVMTEPLARTVPWANADLSFAPTGWIPVPSKGGGAVPMCAPGLSLAMAAAWIAAGPRAVHVVVPLLGALAVWLVYLLARTLDGPAAGACAAVLFAVSPIFLYHCNPGTEILAHCSASRTSCRTCSDTLAGSSKHSRRSFSSLESHHWLRCNGADVQLPTVRERQPFCGCALP
ncbi:MAG: hypothetical protein LC804_15140 [Acidobacteria bacterium]|nr:hypothetical protein [Acidobacteriota bacterium]